MTRVMLRKSQKGFTLIEVMAALGVFTILLLGVTPLVASSLKGAALNREFTVAKNITTEAMERVRGLPFYDAASNRDVLDLYFPNLSTGYDAATKAFTTTCTPTTATPSTSGPLACPPKNSDGTARIPTGYTVTFVAEFVEAVLNSSPETYTVVAPVAGWTSNAEPPSRLLRLTVTTAWTQIGSPRSYPLTSFVGDRRLSPEKIKGEAAVDFVVQALTSYQQNTSSATTALQAIAGSSRSKIQLKNLAVAEQETSAARLTLTRQEFGTTPGTVIFDQSGAQSVLGAPPDTSPAPRVDGVGFTMTNPDLSGSPTIAGVTTNAVNETATPAAGVSVPNQLPSASGNFAFTAGNGPDHFWVNNQKESGGLLQWGSDDTKIFSVHRVADKKLTGRSSAVATAVAPTSSRKVETAAHAEAKRMVLLPTSFASEGVVVIDDFVADVGCKSTGTLGSATVSGTWTATLKYWRDTTNNGLAFGGYSLPIPLSGLLGSTTTDPLAAISKSNNPLVYDSVLSSGDIYLFDDPATGRKGYLDSWSSKPEIFSSKTATKSSVNIDFALQIVTAQTNPTNAQTKLALTIGKLSCSAEDLR